MKRIFCFSLVALLMASPVLRAQDAASAAAAAARRQEAEENYKSLKGTVDDLLAAQADQARKIEALAKEIANMREQMAKPVQNNSATQEDVKRLADAINDANQKRKADEEKIVNDISRQIAKLGNVKPPPPVHQADKPPVTDTGSKTPEDGYTYEVKPNDTFSRIAAVYREQGVKVTSDQIAKANPNADSAKLKVGQKLFIPAAKLQ